MGSINAMKSYQNFYHVDENAQQGTGIVFAIFNVGQMTGSFFIWLADWRGRKLPIFVGCFGVIIGTIVTATAPTLGAFIGGRFLLSFFATIATTAAPMYMIELAPPQYRATVAGMYNTLYYMGSIIATFGKQLSTALRSMIRLAAEITSSVLRHKHPLQWSKH